MDTSEAGKLLPPLLVNIQSANTQILDFNGVKSRNVTCVETSNLFLIIGCASGTTYVFSRESLKFLFVIGFKGGKVCSISCAPDESDLAIGSVRGKISVYRLSPNLHVALPAVSSPAECFRHLYTVPHHTDFEVSEMKWSPNGKFLFIGDSQGVVSQVDVGSLEEFPRPPPSQIILKVVSRVLQMDCVFPYLGVCSTSGVFLCDLEKEDYTRVKNKRNEDIKATGLCFKLEKMSESSQGKEHNYFSGLGMLIGEFGSGRILTCNMQGKIVSIEKVKLNPFQNGPARIFDPKSITPVNYSGKEAQVQGSEVTFALGRLYSGENDYLITLLNDRLFVIDSRSLEVLLWSEDFQRIKSLNMISNYMFIWNGNKVDVVSFTKFRSYAVQLLNAGLHTVLEQWIAHTVRSVGWLNESINKGSDTEDSIEKSLGEEQNATAELFEACLGEINENDPLCSFVIPLLPFELPSLKKIEIAEEIDPFTVAVEKFLCDIQNVLESNGSEGNSEAIEHPFSNVWKMIESFYIDIGAEVPERDESKETDSFSLPKIVSKTYTFLKQPQLVNLPELFENHSPTTVETVIKVVAEFLACISCPTSTVDICTNEICFKDLNSVLRKSDWFSKIGVSQDNILKDILLADSLILVIPLLKQENLVDIMTSNDVIENIQNSFCTWIVATNFVNDQQKFPYAPLLRTLQSESFKVHPKDVLSHIYQDLLAKDIYRPAKYLPHFVTAMILTGSSKGSQRIVLSTLMSILPFKNWPKRETIEKIETLCSYNELLLQIYLLACVEDETFPSTDLCHCGLPNVCANYKTPLFSFQKIVEEGILRAMAKPARTTIHNINSIARDIQDFALKRFLFEPYMKLFTNQLTSSVKINLVLRTGSLSLLSTFLIRDSNEMKLLMEKVKCYRTVLPGENFQCDGCKQEVMLENNFQPLTEESVALWIFKETGSIQKLIDIVDNTGLNTPNVFSLRFYQQLVKI